MYFKTKFVLICTLSQMKIYRCELGRVSVLTLDVTQFVTPTEYVSPVASVWQVS